VVVPVIKVNWNHFQAEEEVARRVKDEWTRLQNIRLVDFPAAPNGAAKP